MELYPQQFVALSESKVKDQLMLDGIDDMTVKDSTGLSKGSRIMAVATRKFYVHYAGPLAGYQAGYFVAPNGKKILVTESVKLIEAGKSKKIPRTLKFLDELLEDQTIYFLCWLKIALASLRRGDFMPGQLLGLVGEPGCGKTFLQWFITQLLGGRSGLPYQYMTGGTKFNLDLAQAEHWAMGDEEAKYDIRSRRGFGAQIKKCCVEPEMWIQGKGINAVVMQTYRRASLACNREAEHIQVFPPIDEDLRDKVMLFKCSKAELSADRLKNQREFTAELPNFITYLESLAIPKDLFDKRFGVKAYQHPEILELLNGLAPEMQLLSLIDEVIFADQKDDAPVRLSAEQLKVQLLKSDYHQTVLRLLDWAPACGTFLSRLAAKYPHRFEMRKSKGKATWIIRKASDDQ